MKILLAPSETKIAGGHGNFQPCSLLFDNLCPDRNKILHLYTNVLQRANADELTVMFGLKKPDDIAYHSAKDIINEPTMKAIERYTGVVFEYLQYTQLEVEEQAHIDSSVILFSNLFGALRADDMIPEYRLQQGKAIGEIKPEQFYRPLLKEPMDEYLAEEEILDIRAEFYNKFYKPSKPYTTLKFIKDGKVVSHWAKAYRGIVLKEIAKARVASLDEFMRLPIDGLSIVEIQTKGDKREVIYEIA